MSDAKRVLVPVADSSEDIELACITDVLVRAGAEVTVASVMAEPQVKLARGLKVRVSRQRLTYSPSSVAALTLCRMSRVAASGRLQNRRVCRQGVGRDRLPGRHARR